MCVCICICMCACNTKSLDYKSLVCPVLVYGSECWDPFREGQINA